MTQGHRPNYTTLTDATARSGLSSSGSRSTTSNVKAPCSDQNNPDLYKKPLQGAAICLPQTIGSTTGGMVLFCAAALGQQPACLLFSKPIDSLAAAGAILSDVWTETHMPVVDSLGDEFLEYVKTGMSVTLAEDGTVTVE